jgi:glycine betaine/proline transport system permease protein
MESPLKRIPVARADIKTPDVKLWAKGIVWGAVGIAVLVMAFTVSREFPESWVIRHEVASRINDATNWIVANGSGFFDNVIRTPVLFLTKSLFERALMWMPWWFVATLVGAVAWRLAGSRVAIFSIGSLILIAFLGLHDLAMMTMAIILGATLLAVGAGLPLGILSAKNDRFESVTRPILDAMQTMPSFVYLIPALMLLGMGRVPAVMATVVYAIPPMIRLTNLAIRQVDPEVVEAAKAFGSTRYQVLTKVEIPMGMPTIMAGVNQTIMMALAMVVIASMIGAKGLGIEVFNGIARLDIGRGFIGGLGIVLLAVIIDRITQAVGKPRRTREA